MLTLGGTPAPNETLFANIQLSRGFEQTLHLWGVQAQTDATGKFSFDDLPPGQIQISWSRPTHRGASSSHPVTTQVEPGKTSFLDYALAGGSVGGRLVWQGENQIDWRAQARGSLIPKNRHSGALAIQIQNDGGFEVPYVAPGEYTMMIRIQEPPVDGRPPIGGLLAAHRQEVTIPPGQEKFDVGGVVVLPTKTPRK